MYAFFDTHIDYFFPILKMATERSRSRARHSPGSPFEFKSKQLFNGKLNIKVSRNLYFNHIVWFRKIKTCLAIFCLNLPAKFSKI